MTNNSGPNYVPTNNEAYLAGHILLQRQALTRQVSAITSRISKTYRIKATTHLT
jgi:hypothetical protein